MQYLKYLSLLFALSLGASCGGGSGDNTGVGTPQSPGLPLVPTNVTATGGHNSIAVDWVNSQGASSFNVYWSDQPNVSTQGPNRVNVLRGPVTITGLSNGTTYYAVVTAQNSFGETGASSEVQAQATPTLPGKVTGIYATPGDGEVLVEWASQHDADSYEVVAGSLTSTDAVVASNAVGPMTLSGLTNGVTYAVTVTAVNSVGKGSRSGPVDITPLAPVRGWSDQVQINESFESYLNQAHVEAFAINDDGVAALTWYSDVSRSKRLHISHNLSGTWSPQISLGTDVDQSSVAITPNGDIHVAYASFPETIIWRRIQAGEMSDPMPVQVSEDRDRQILPYLAADGLGNVFMAWLAVVRQPGAPHTEDTYELWVRRFDGTNDAWEEPQKIGESVSQIWDVSIEAGNSNVAIVSWSQDTLPYDETIEDGGPERRVVYAGRYDGSSWLPGTVVGHNDLLDYDDTRVNALDVNENGDAVVSWKIERKVGSEAASSHSYEIGAARFDGDAGTWSARESILVSALSVTSVMDTAIDRAGIGTVAWLRRPNSQVDSASYDNVAALWGEVQELPTDPIATGSTFAIEKESGGDTVLLWTRHYPPKGIFVRRLAAGSASWGSVDLIGGRIDISSATKLAMSRNGHMLVVNKASVFQDETIKTVIYAITYTPESP